MKRIFSVSLNPAKPTKWGGIEIRFDLTGKKENSFKKIEASNLDELATQVEAFAKEYGQGCAAFVRVVDGGRKPNGFDKRFRDLFFNLDAREVAGE